ncbi:MAG: polysaccharide lyase beta-sandwich domain-containing protein, partial [Vallitalea sp.]|nr:polysaccharide lyase beta-sandwich domain-containing protein [Vallitalea sp.]
NKSVFFFDDVIVRLGSDIRCDDKNNPIQTTLFQNNLNGDKSMPMYINSDNKITDFPYKCTDDNITWIIDPYNNGYYIPNSSELNIYRDTQHSRDGGNKIDTSGEYATAYLDHGKAPKSASYEYAIKVQTTPQEMAHFSKNPTYKVLQQDSIAHIVKNNISNAVGYAIFDADKYSGKDFILSADTPVLAMVKENDAKNVSLYLSDPDLRLPYIEDLDELNSGEERPSTMKVATIKINGEWEIDGASEGVKIVKSKDGKTTLAFDCIDGLTISVNLKVK